MEHTNKRKRTISRAELAAIAAATIHGYSHIAADSLTSMHQIKKQLSHPNLHRHHIQGDILRSIAKAIHQSPLPIHSYKIKSHAGVIGNEYASAIARKSITIYSDVADTPTKTADPEGIRFRFCNITLLTCKRNRNINHTKHNHPNTAQSPSSRLWL